MVFKLCSAVFLIWYISLTSWVTVFFSVKIQFHINENPILPNFRHRISTFINARKGIVCFLRRPPQSDSFRRAFSRLSDPCASIYSYIWSDPRRQFASIMIHFRKSFGFFVWLIVFWFGVLGGWGIVWFLRVWSGQRGARRTCTREADNNEIKQLNSAAHLTESKTGRGGGEIQNQWGQAAVDAEVCFQRGKRPYITPTALATSPCPDVRISWRDLPETQLFGRVQQRLSCLGVLQLKKTILWPYFVVTNFPKPPRGSSGAFSSERLWEQLFQRQNLSQGWGGRAKKPKPSVHSAHNTLLGGGGGWFIIY